ncbi:MAG: pectinesterase family protein, partial [Thermoanaerobaculia bacterium]
MIVLLLGSAVFPPSLSAEIAVFADYSDPDVIRVGEDYFLVASSFQAVPGLPILQSRDLKQWTLVGHAVTRLPSPDFDRPQHGNGLWAPSIRHHGGFFWIYVGDPDRGLFMTRAKDVRGPWEPLTLVKAAKGWIDPCPLWDDDGSMYLVHAWAKSRAGFNGVLTVNRMSPDGRAVLDEGTVVFDGRERHPTIEGPKFHKRNGWYYIFAPAGGVKRGWQTVLRSKNVFGPYEDKIVLEQGTTSVNGPHQGAWIDDSFIHFQDRGAYGRILHRQKLAWVNDWPEIGRGGEPEPVDRVPAPTIQTSDEFDGPAPGLQWQWQGNPSKRWFALRGGRLRLSATPDNLWSATNLLLQKFAAPAFSATTLVDASSLKNGERAGLVILGADYAALTIGKSDGRVVLHRVTARNADRDGAESEEASVTLPRGPVRLRVDVSPEAICRFSYAPAGEEAFKPIGRAFVARPGRWIGAKVGLFGPATFDWFRVVPFEPRENASLIVAKDGSADFTTIQQALDAIPADNDDDRTILVRNGVHREKVMIAKSHVALVGEDRDATRIEFAELRRNWRASRPDDYGAAVINIADGATDVTIANLTLVNDYGRRSAGEDDHQFAIRSMGLSNRIAILHANVRADGGDTLSLWNSESGLSYATDCTFEGHVDFVCPRGWSYVTNSRFFARNLTAAIWHDGSRDRDQKFVIRRSKFDGVPGFPLGRNHRDAQFYLLDVEFSANMADRPIYPSPAPDPRQWGERYYYSNARREAGSFPWFADNLEAAEGSPRSEDITATWTFAGRWDPATLPAVLPFAAIPQPENGWRWVDPAGATLRWTGGRNARTQRVHFGTSESPEFRTEQTATSFTTGSLEPGRTYFWRVDSVTPEGVVAGPLWSFVADPRTTRIALAGDSTVTDKSGWGRGFEAHVGESAALLNLARGGRSSKSYVDEGHWAALLARKPTHVLLQFGHNDVPGKGLDRETD